MATYLEQQHWQENPRETELTASSSTRRLHKQFPKYNIPHLTVAHVRNVLTEFHAYKAPGPDFLEADLFKQLPANAIQFIADHLNQWVSTGHLDTSQLKARVASLFKKGDFKNAEDYRPISLLDTIYKLKARVIKDILEKGIERELQPTQYAFRKIVARFNQYTASDA